MRISNWSSDVCSSDLPEEWLGGPPAALELTESHVLVPQLDVGASAGPGALPDRERPRAHLAFGARWLRRLGSGDFRKLSTIRDEGDSMSPTLAAGDEILVERSEPGERVRARLYVLRMDAGHTVKRQ